MKTVSIQKTSTTFFLPATDLLATYQGISKEETRYYLRGVYCEKVGEAYNLVSTDGHILMKSELESGAHIGSDCFTQTNDNDSGFILSVDIMEKAFKAKSHYTLWVYGDKDTGVLQIIDYDTTAPDEEHKRVGVCEFTMVDGTYPEYRRVMPLDTNEFALACFNPALIARFQKAGDILAKARGQRAMGAMSLDAGGDGNPMLVKFSGEDRFTGVLMPMRFL